MIVLILYLLFKVPSLEGIKSDEEGWSKNLSANREAIGELAGRESFLRLENKYEN